MAVQARRGADLVWNSDYIPELGAGKVNNRTVLVRQVPNPQLGGFLGRQVESFYVAFGVRRLGTLRELHSTYAILPRLFGRESKEGHQVVLYLLLPKRARTPLKPASTLSYIEQRLVFPSIIVIRHIRQGYKLGQALRRQAWGSPIPALAGRPSIRLVETGVNVRVVWRVRISLVEAGTSDCVRRRVLVARVGGGVVVSVPVRVLVRILVRILVPVRILVHVLVLALILDRHRQEQPAMACEGTYEDGSANEGLYIEGPEIFVSSTLSR